MTGDLIRVVLADDHAVVRAGLVAVLSAAGDIEIVGQAKNGIEAVALAERFRPDLVLMDLTMPDMDGVTATKAIIALGLSIRVLVLTMHNEEEFLVPLMEAGASGYLEKNASDRELVDAIRAVAHDDLYFRAGAANVLARNLANRNASTAEQDMFALLTRREQEVLRLVALGFSAPEIGTKLEISPKTVDTYKQRIHEKLGLAHRSEYVHMAVKLGIMSS